MNEDVLYGVSKKMRITYLQGKIPASLLENAYKQNLKEAKGFSAYGLNLTDLRMMLYSCHNPILKAKIKDSIITFEKKSRKSSDQNKLSIKKLNDFLANAMGIGLRRVIRIMRNRARKSKDLTLNVISTLLEVEFANLCAKNTHDKQLKEVIYERKSILLDKVGRWLVGTEWRYGYNDNCGKNASYIIYIYLPNGVQLSWHSNDYNLYKKFPYVETEWDGKVCTTMEKLLDYVAQNYSSFFMP